MKSLARRLKALEGRTRVGEVPEIEVWTESVERPGVYQNHKTDAELTREGVKQRTAERRERYGPGHVLAIVVNYVDSLPERGRGHE